MIRILAILAVLAGPAFADEPPAARPPAASPSAPTQPVQEPRSGPTVHTWGATHPDCAQWSDSCVICTRGGCSTPGIACVPAEIACRR